MVIKLYQVALSLVLWPGSQSRWNVIKVESLMGGTSAQQGTNNCGDGGGGGSGDNDGDDDCDDDMHSGIRTQGFDK